MCRVSATDDGEGYWIVTALLAVKTQCAILQSNSQQVTISSCFSKINGLNIRLSFNHYNRLRFGNLYCFFGSNCPGLLGTQTFLLPQRFSFIVPLDFLQPLSIIQRFPLLDRNAVHHRRTCRKDNHNQQTQDPLKNLKRGPIDESYS